MPSRSQSQRCSQLHATHARTSPTTMLKDRIRKKKNKRAHDKNRKHLLENLASQPRQRPLTTTNSRVMERTKRYSRYKVEQQRRIVTGPRSGPSSEDPECAQARYRTSRRPRRRTARRADDDETRSPRFRRDLRRDADTSIGAFTETRTPKQKSSNPSSSSRGPPVGRGAGRARPRRVRFSSFLGIFFSFLHARR